MKLAIKKSDGSAAGEFSFEADLVSDGSGTQAVHDTVTAYRAAQRSGTACAKTMGDVAGTGKKPWRQKGTGRARSGSFASPLWRGGGVVFGPKPRDFAKKVNKQTRQAALLKVLSERIAAGDVTIIEKFEVLKPSTKQVLNTLRSVGIDGTTLLVVERDVNRNLLLSCRNIPHVDVCSASNINVYQLLRNDKILLTQDAAKEIDATIR